MERLEQLLEESYIRLKSQECIDAVIEFLQMHDSVVGRDMAFVTSLVKVAHHILLDFPKALNADLIEKIYRFDLEGVRILDDTGPNSGIPNDRYLLLKSNFLSYAGDAAEIRLELGLLKGEHLETLKGWAEQSYDARLNAAQTAYNINKRHSARHFSLAGKAARQRFEIAITTKESREGKATWLKNWYNAQINSANLLLERDPLRAAYSYVHAGDAARIMFNLTKDPQWGRRSIDCYEGVLACKIEESPNQTQKLLGKALTELEYLRRQLK